ncbi:hypothetical protein DPMN_106571 [Dreissena polymorpha]|uniref:Uncharacterized protein n=1 Tax=Dreissena polymorpha TaxID=45954 RepID=A0A9D4QIY7_DREPO|nr:hypothetical protein DPMN_106571 [Dreissena polymorpha]
MTKCHGTVSDNRYPSRKERWEPECLPRSVKNKCCIIVTVTFICLYPVEGTMIDGIFIYLCV